jgi:ankyrin repeat protein
MPVHAAAAFGETECLEALLDNGATVEDRTEGVTFSVI